MRAKAYIEEEKHRIIFTEIPYQVNKRMLIKNMADQVEDKRLEGISDIRDETDRTGMRIVIELKRDGNVYSPVKEMLRELRIKPSGFSKYCIGSALTKPALKRNRFKKKFVKINKLLNNH